MSKLKSYPLSSFESGFDDFDDCAIYKINEKQSIIQTVDFFTPIVDDPYTFGLIAAANSLSDIYAMGGNPLFSLNIAGFPSDDLPISVLGEIFNGGQNIAEKAQIPVVTTLLGISSFPENHILSTGFPGMHGMAYASIALDEADLIIGIGSRFDDRIVGNAKRFGINSKKIHIDIDPAEINKTVKIDAPIIGDIDGVLKILNPKINTQNHIEWLKQVEHIKAEHPSLTIPESDSLLGQQVIKTLSDITKGDAIICTGVGQHQMWAAQHYQFTKPNSWLSSGGLGTMGYEIPSAIGAQFGAPDKTVWSICGDGGFQMTIGELATVAENNLPIKYAILNNNHLGMITQWQDMFYQGQNMQETYTGNPDFVKLAEAYGIKGIRVENQDQLQKAINDANNHDGPVIIDFVIEKVDYVYPMIPAGGSVDQLIEEDKKK